MAMRGRKMRKLRTRRAGISLAATVLASAALLVACDEPGGCFPVVKPALTVIVEDARGEDVTFAPDLVMEYQVNGDGDWRSCDLVPRYWNCSDIREGRHEVRATLGDLSGTNDISMWDDDAGCHLVPRGLRVVVE